MPIALSRNEVTATVVKAARGAGWGVGLGEALANALTSGADVPWDHVCALFEMEARTVSRDGARISGHPAAAIPAALDWVRATGRQVEITDADPALIAVYVAAARDIDAKGTTLRARSDGHAGALETTQVTRFEIETEVWNTLLDRAARCYVPATEASRAAGAGAGLTDND